jgi:glucose 1-dehydrogenase
MLEIAISRAKTKMSDTKQMRFEGKVCLVTGGGSGIGKAAAQRFAAEGGKVVIVDINEQHGNQAVQDIEKTGGDAIFAKANVGVSAEVQAAVQAGISKWGRLDVVVNDAAMMTFTPVVDLPEDDWDKVLGVNLRSVFLFCKYAAPHMKPGGAFVNISSVHAHETTANVVPYASSKGGMEAFTRGFSQELAPLKLRINCVAPGAVNTPMLWNNPNVKSGTEKIEGAVGEPEDIAAAICFLAAEEARFITGTTLTVDGGRLDIL